MLFLLIDSDSKGFASYVTPLTVKGIAHAQEELSNGLDCYLCENAQVAKRLEEIEREIHSCDWTPNQSPEQREDFIELRREFEGRREELRRDGAVRELHQLSSFLSKGIGDGR